MFEVQARNLKSARYWFSIRNRIDMEPEYQRSGGIWSLEDKQYLIDSILNEYDIPKLYLADFTTIKSVINEDNLQFAVIDGKQRIEAIFGFLSNDYPLSRKFQYQKNENLALRGLYYKDLQRSHEAVAAVIEEYPMPIMHVVTDELEKINELFVRLNKGANLTGAEKRNAMIGPVPKMLRRIAEHEFFAECVRYQTKRGQNLNAAAKLLIFELSEGPVDTKKVSLDDMVREADEGQIKVAFQKTLSGLDKMRSVFGNRDPLLSSQGQIPVYYWVCRDQSAKRLGIFRQFLEEFQSELNLDKELNREDTDYAAYRQASRSVNDDWSHNQRAEILDASFRAWLAR